ncbi:MAG TPA: rhomboid family intramembrane serine protease [Verrucomicrobiae bacterium]|nr:rhomboid family intramembrane serine protease [Verrucomicrobiae bacterium]
MLEDRDYMRQPAYHEPRISFTVALLIVNAVVFVIQLVADNFPRGLQVEYEYFALSIAGLSNGYVWQLLTFQFMHASWMHLIFNSLAIFFFGRSVETVLGRSRFLAVYFSSGIIGGAMQMLFALWRPDFFGGAVVGASAGAYGLVAAFAVINWTERFTLLVYFIPVTMRGKTLLWVSIGLALVGLLTPGSGIANAAHLGGILTGFFCVRYIFGRWPQLEFPSRRSQAREFAATSVGKKSFWRSAANQPDEDLSADEFLQREVDPILEKISAHGIHSLTARERETLEKARVKMVRR